MYFRRLWTALTICPVIFNQIFAKRHQPGNWSSTSSCQATGRAGNAAPREASPLPLLLLAERSLFFFKCLKCSQRQVFWPSLPPAREYWGQKACQDTFASAHTSLGSLDYIRNAATDAFFLFIAVELPERFLIPSCRRVLITLGILPWLSNKISQPFSSSPVLLGAALKEGPAAGPAGIPSSDTGCLSGCHGCHGSTALVQVFALPQHLHSLCCRCC